MIRLFFCFFILFASLNAGERQTATKIINAIASVISKSPIVCIDKNDDKLLRKVDIKDLKVMNQCIQCSVVIMDKNSILSPDSKYKPLIVLDYDLLKTNENAVVAFYWKKGRPNIVFIDDRLKKFNIQLPKAYLKYVEDEIW